MQEPEADPQNEILKRLLSVERQAEDLEAEAVRASEQLLGQARTELEETRRKRLLEKASDCERRFQETRKSLEDTRSLELENFKRSLESLEPDKARFRQELTVILSRPE